MPGATVRAADIAMLVRGAGSANGDTEHIGAAMLVEPVCRSQGASAASRLMGIGVKAEAWCVCLGQGMWGES